MPLTWKIVNRNKQNVTPTSAGLGPRAPRSGCSSGPIAGLQLEQGTARALRPRARAARDGAPAPRRGQPHRVRHGRAVGRASRVRHAGGGDERSGGAHRPARRAADAVAGRSRRLPRRARGHGSRPPGALCTRRATRSGVARRPSTRCTSRCSAYCRCGSRPWRRRPAGGGLATAQHLPHRGRWLVALTAGTDEVAHRSFAVIGRPSCATTRAFATTRAHVRHVQELDALLAD